MRSFAIPACYDTGKFGVEFFPCGTCQVATLCNPDGIRTQMAAGGLGAPRLRDDQVAVVLSKSSNLNKEMLRRTPEPDQSDAEKINAYWGVGIAKQYAGRQQEENERIRRSLDEAPNPDQSDGSTASYYELPKGATELQHLISHRNLNAQLGEIFRACYRYGLVSHSPMKRDIKKIIFYAQAELKRLEALEKQNDYQEETPGNCPQPQTS